MLVVDGCYDFVYIYLCFGIGWYVEIMVYGFFVGVVGCYG